MNPTNLTPTRLVATATGDLQKLDAITGEVLSTIPADRLKALQATTNRANFRERNVKYSSTKCRSSSSATVQRRRAYGIVSTRHHKKQVNLYEELIFWGLCGLGGLVLGIWGR